MGSGDLAGEDRLLEEESALLDAEVFAVGSETALALEQESAARAEERSEMETTDKLVAVRKEELSRQCPARWPLMAM